MLPVNRECAVRALVRWRQARELVAQWIQPALLQLPSALLYGVANRLNTAQRHGGRIVNFERDILTSQLATFFQTQTFGRTPDYILEVLHA